MDDFWHYPRTELAESIVQLFGTHSAYALTLFEERRKGKTEFLLQDLTPIAESSGWRVLYYSFMEGNAQQKCDGFVRVLNDAAAGTLSRFFRPKITASFAGQSMELDLTKNPNPAASLAELISKVAKQKPTIFLLDEVQELAKGGERATQLIQGLRTGLDINRTRIKTVFTGSSREQLRRMFGTQSAPFFHFGTTIEFPNLGLEFIQHLVKKYKEATGREIDEGLMWESFVGFHKTPGYLRDALADLILNPNREFRDIVSAKQTALAGDNSFILNMKQLPALERNILLLLAQSGRAKIYSAGFRASLATAIGMPSITPSQVQVALDKLAAANFVYKDAGAYKIEDSHFAEWLATEYTSPEQSDDAMAPTDGAPSGHE